MLLYSHRYWESNRSSGREQNRQNANTVYHIDVPSTHCWLWNSVSTILQVQLDNSSNLSRHAGLSRYNWVYRFTPRYAHYSVEPTSDSSVRDIAGVLGVVREDEELPIGSTQENCIQRKPGTWRPSWRVQPRLKYPTLWVESHWTGILGGN